MIQKKPIACVLLSSLGLWVIAWAGTLSPWFGLIYLFCVIVACIAVARHLELRWAASHLVLQSLPFMVMLLGAWIVSGVDEEAPQGIPFLLVWFLGIFGTAIGHGMSRRYPVKALLAFYGIAIGVGICMGLGVANGFLRHLW